MRDRISGYLRFSFSMASGLGIILMALSGPASAFNFGWDELSGSLDSQVSLGAAWRADDRDPRLIGKSNLNPGLCLRREADGSIAGDGCNSTSDPALNNAFVAQPGSFSSNGDNGNLNYDKGDLVAGAFKLTSDLNLSWRNYGALIRGSYFYDAVNTDFEETHPDTTFQPRKTDRPKGVEKLVGNDLQRLDSYVFGSFPFLGDRQLTVRVGDQVLNWGESTFLLANSLNHIAPPSLARLRAPAFDVKELFVPVGMVYLGTELMPSLSLEAFYQYKWAPAVPDPVGSFYSTSDILGEGGTHAMLSFSKAPEDPTQSYDPKTNADITCLLTGCETDRTGLFSSSSRTILRDEDRLPDDGGEYGFKLTYFAEALNGGTEFGLYHSNTHSRLPIASAYAANASCIGDGSGVVQALSPLECGPPLPGIGPIGFLGLANEPLPVETARVFAEYPEDIKLYGLSFNTTIGDWAWSGEVAYRPNQPLQIHSTDLLLASLQPAFPATDVPVCAGAGLVIPGFPAPIGDCAPGLPVVTVIPGRRSAVPDFVETRYRGNTVTPGAYVQGYEEMKVANFGTSFLNTIGASNPFKADQIVVVFELGATKVFDMPGLDELQFNAAGADTHISGGADGTAGLGGNTLGSGCLANGDNATACRQNPTAADPQAFPDDMAWGFRNVWVLRYQDALYGVNLEPLLGWFRDIDGIAPGPGENFIEGRNTYLLGLRFDYLNQWSGEMRYTAESGAGKNNPRIDRDVLSLNVRYEF
jgi:hypothetical protein